MWRISVSSLFVLACFSVVLSEVFDPEESTENQPNCLWRWLVDHHKFLLYHEERNIDAGRTLTAFSTKLAEIKVGQCLFASLKSLMVGFVDFELVCNLGSDCSSDGLMRLFPHIQIVAGRASQSKMKSFVPQVQTNFIAYTRGCYWRINVDTAHAVIHDSKLEDNETMKSNNFALFKSFHQYIGRNECKSLIPSVIICNIEKSRGCALENVDQTEFAKAAAIHPLPIKSQQHETRPATPAQYQSLVNSFEAHKHLGGECLFKFHFTFVNNGATITRVGLADTAKLNEWIHNAQQSSSCRYTDGSGYVLCLVPSNVECLPDGIFIMTGMQNMNYHFNPRHDDKSKIYKIVRSYLVWRSDWISKFQNVRTTSRSTTTTTVSTSTEQITTTFEPSSTIEITESTTSSSSESSEVGFSATTEETTTEADSTLENESTTSIGTSDFSTSTENIEIGSTELSTSATIDNVGTTASTEGTTSSSVALSSSEVTVTVSLENDSTRNPGEESTSNKVSSTETLSSEIYSAIPSINGSTDSTTVSSAISYSSSTETVESSGMTTPAGNGVGGNGPNQNQTSTTESTTESTSSTDSSMKATEFSSTVDSTNVPENIPTTPEVNTTWRTTTEFPTTIVSAAESTDLSSIQASTSVTWATEPPESTEFLSSSTLYPFIVFPPKVWESSSSEASTSQAATMEPLSSSKQPTESTEMPKSSVELNNSSMESTSVSGTTGSTTDSAHETDESTTDTVSIDFSTTFQSTRDSFSVVPGFAKSTEFSSTDLTSSTSSMNNFNTSSSTMDPTESTKDVSSSTVESPTTSSSTDSDAVINSTVPGELSSTGESSTISSTDSVTTSIDLETTSEPAESMVTTSEFSSSSSEIMTTEGPNDVTNESILESSSSTFPQEIPLSKSSTPSTVRTSYKPSLHDNPTTMSSTSEPTTTSTESSAILVNPQAQRSVEETTPENDSDDDSSAPLAVILPVVILSLLLLGGIVICIFVYRRKNRKKDKKEDVEEELPSTPKPKQAAKSTATTPKKKKKVQYIRRHDLHPDLLPKSQFQYKGPLKMNKNMKGTMTHLEDETGEKSHSIREKVEIDPTLNEIHRIGTDIEQYTGEDNTVSVEEKVAAAKSGPPTIPSVIMSSTNNLQTKSEKGKTLDV